LIEKIKLFWGKDSFKLSGLDKLSRNDIESREA